MCPITVVYARIALRCYARVYTEIKFIVKQKVQKWLLVRPNMACIARVSLSVLGVHVYACMRRRVDNLVWTKLTYICLSSVEFLHDLRCVRHLISAAPLNHLLHFVQLVFLVVFFVYLLRRREKYVHRARREPKNSNAKIKLANFNRMNDFKMSFSVSIYSRFLGQKAL